MNIKNKTKKKPPDGSKQLSPGINKPKKPEKKLKQTPEILRDREQHYKRIFEFSPEVIGFIDIYGNLIDVNERLYDWLGYKPSEVINKNFINLPFMPEESKKIATEKLSQTIRSEKIYPYELNFITKQGEIRVGRIVAAPIKDEDGKLIGELVMASDITESKRSEEALKESEQSFRQLVELSPDTILIHCDGKIELINSAGVKLFGASSPEQLIGKNVMDFVHLEYKKKIKGRIQKIRNGNKTPFMEQKILRLDGSVVDVEASGLPFVYKGKNAIQFVAREITERKQMEKMQATIYKISEATQFTESLEELYGLIHNTIIELMPAKENFYIALYDEEKGELTFPYFVDEYEGNPGPRKPGKGLTEYVLKKAKPLLASPKVFNDLEKKGEVISVGPPSIDWLGVPLKTKDKTIGVMVTQSYTKGVRFSEKDKDILMFMAEQVAMAIERKQAQEHIKQLQKYLQLQIDRMPIGLIVWDEKFRVVSWNPAAEKIFGFSEGKARGKHPYDLIVPKEAQAHVDEIWSRLLDGDITAHSTNENITQDGRTIICAWSNTPFKREDSHIIGVLSMVQDVTERRKSEEKIKASLKEKEILLQEIHHRVKNNMQIISSLLRLQSDRLKDGATLDMFRISQNRIKSMSLIHETLYKAKDFTKIDFTHYIQNLIPQLFHAYQVSTNKIKLNTDLDEVFLSINTAIPCGLIVNELLSNSLKHAFPKSRSGELVVSLRSEKSSVVTMIISDDGVGIPEKIDIKKPETLGLQLVIDLVNQIGGTIELDRDKRTEWKISF